ncbi:MAG TPA: ATP-binding protein [Sphingobium sp.]|uniref:ATP-binding protein n=1 Tax=Sphingobium sp. TaxID=1912891 RepID=UPI002ED1AC9C
MASSHRDDLLDITGRPSARHVLPALAAAAFGSAAVLYAAVREPALAGGFAATVIAAAFLLWYARRLFPANDLANQAVVTDWTVARAAAQAAGSAIAITDRNGRLICASDQFGEWFPSYPTPPQLKLAGPDVERLTAAGRIAWRDGEARVEGIARGALLLDADIVRTGRSEDYLLWRFSPVVQANVMDDCLRIITGQTGEHMAEAGVMTALIGAEGRVRAANAAFLLRATGRTDSNIIGRDLAAYMRVDAKGRIFFAREEQRAVPIRIVQVPIRANDPSGPMLLIMLDDSMVGVDATSSLAYVETLLSLLPFGLAMADRDGRLLFYNNAFGRAAGISANDRPSYPGDLLIAEDQAAVAEAIRRYAVGSQVSGDIAVRLRTQPDEPVSLSLAGVRGLGEASVLLSLRDNTEETRLKRQVAQQTKMQAVGQLAGGVAHDFNNVLTAIIGHCDLMLMRHTPGDSDYDDIQQIKSNSNRAASLTRQLLAFSRQQTLRPQVLQLPDVVSEVSALLKRLLGENINLAVTHGRGLGPVRADPGQLEQVIVNLVVNARDAMTHGGTVTIRTFAVPASEVRTIRAEIMPVTDYTAFSVSDSGTGIPPEVLGKIFEPFFTTKEVGKGTGLGLSTVYGIVKQSGGFIFAESEIGKGTDFLIYLPVHAGQPGETTVRAPQRKAPAPDTWGTGTILLVEDEDMVRNVAERALTRQGYSVTVASDGEQGLARLAEMSHVDLLISDVVMPGMDGPAMVRAARRNHPDLPVLFMSGYAEEQLRKSIDIANVSFLPKPFSVAQIAEAARDALAEGRSEANPAQLGEHA